MPAHSRTLSAMTEEATQIAVDMPDTDGGDRFDKKD